MTVVLNDGSKSPGSHVLLIGAGDYPFLKGGTPPAGDATFAFHMEMGQLSSPPVSVRKVADWFLDPNDGFHNPERPLRSLEVLCSAPTPMLLPDHSGATHAIDRAQVSLVVKAIKDWVKRASENEENIAFLYFCGHGLSFGETQNALLLEGFGGDTLNPMSDAIAFDELRMGLMQQCRARYQCHFIDACRTPPKSAFKDKYGPGTGVTVVSGGLSASLRSKVAPVFFATGLASPAYGVPNEASLFTQGMLRCFRGVGSRDANNHWEVSVPAIAEGINKCVESLAFSEQPQFCQPRDTGQPLLLHQLRTDPEVIVKISMQDKTQLQTSLLRWRHDDTQKIGERLPNTQPWWQPLTVGGYTFQAMDGGDPTQVLNVKKKYVAPPSAEVWL